MLIEYNMDSRNGLICKIPFYMYVGLPLIISMPDYFVFQN